MHFPKHYPGFKAVPTTVHDASIWVGKNYFDLQNPNPAEIHLSDIARGLSRECRYNGHGREFYSVAEHSVNCVLLFNRYSSGDIFTDPFLRDIASDILMHDAHEYVCKDQTSPLKRLIAPLYNPIADRIQAAISARFNLAECAPEWVKRVDIEMLAAEKLDLMPDAPDDWPVLANITAPEIFIWCHYPEVAEANFVDMAERLGISNRWSA
ncbi:hypothetical protein [Roseobacter litoralis]|uniref:hypothetical protein n=1 Tax=Roseobacter litoralis TaxID=42443 RepID=UPI0024947AA3|nr:hypothetical protein [Roseobacter litoralis]